MFFPLNDDDIPTIVDLMNRAYRGNGPVASWNSEVGHLAGDRATAETLRAQLTEKPEAKFLKWMDPSNSRVIGCVCLEPEAARSWYLSSLAIEPEQQRFGLGRELLLAAEDWIRARNGSLVRITVINVRESLIAWYERRGYYRTGETEPFPYGDNRFGIPLRDDLSFVVMAKEIAWNG